MKSEDDILIDLLRDAVEQVEHLDPVAIDMAKACLTWSPTELELAQLVHDSSTDTTPASTTVRGTPVERILKYETHQVLITLEKRGNDLIGTIVPPQAASITLRRSTRDVLAASAVSTETLETGARGFFTFPDVGPGLMSVECTAGDGSWAARTEWTVI